MKKWVENLCLYSQTSLRQNTFIFERIYTRTDVFIPERFYIRVPIHPNAFKSERLYAYAFTDWMPL